MVSKTCVSLWCSSQGVARTCRYTGFDSRRRCFLFVCTVFIFFFCLVLVFPFRLFFFILTADLAGHALGSIYILSLSPEYYFGKGISRVLDLHTGQAYGQKKPQAVNLCPLSSQTAAFFEMLVDIMTNNTQYTRRLY